MTRLQTIRLSKAISRAELAERADVTYHTIRRHELGEGSISEDSLFKLAKALEVNPTDLIDPKPEPVAEAS